MRKHFVLLVGLMFIVVFYFVSFGEAANLKPFKVAGISAPEYRGTKSLYTIKKKIEKGTEGRIKLDIFPANQLGDYTQVFDEIRRGSIEMGLIFLPSQFDVMLEIGSLPFLSSTGAGMKKQLSPGSIVYEIIDQSLEKLGIKLLRIYGDGFIGVGLSKKPTNPTSTAGKNALIRVAPVAVYKETANDMGFRTTNIPYADTYSAIQTGVCDGWIGGSSQINYFSFRDIIKYYIPYNCLFDQTAYIINKKLWNSLNPKDQKIIMDAVNHEADKSFDDSAKEDLEFQKKLVESGVEIIEITNDQRAKIADHIRKNTWPKLSRTYGEKTLEKIKKSL